MSTQVEWPTGATFLKVVCRLGLAAADSADAGTDPDLMTQGGTVTLSMGATRARLLGGDGRWRSVALPQTAFTVDVTTGELVDGQGVVGVWVLDPTSPGVDPAGWSYTAQVKPTTGGDWSVTFSQADAVAGVVDLVAVSTVTAPSAGVSTLDSRVSALEAEVSAIVSGALPAGTAAGQVLTWTGTAWVAQAPTGGASDATTTSKGVVQLAGDLGGTAAAPTVPGLAGKASTSHTHTLDQTTDTATRLALTPAERTKLANTTGTNSGDQTLPTWGTLSGKPAVVAAGDDAAAARTAIGAGTSSLAIGTTGTTAAAGNDGRLSNARTPTAHASTHKTGGSDPVTVTTVAGVTLSGTPSAGQVPTATSPSAATWATPAAGGGGGLLPVWTPPLGKWALTRSNNGFEIMGGVLGTEYAVGIVLPAVTINQLTLVVNDTSADGVFLVGIRPIAADGTIDAPVAQAAFSGAAFGNITVTLASPVALTLGLYALTWCRARDTANTMTVQRSDFEQNNNLFSMASGEPAHGHGNVIGTINRGIATSATTLPNTVTISAEGTNQEFGLVPQILANRCV